MVKVTATEILRDSVEGPLPIYFQPKLLTVHGPATNWSEKLAAPFRRTFGKSLIMSHMMPNICKECGRPFRTAGGLLSHYSRYHEHDKRKQS